LSLKCVSPLTAWRSKDVNEATGKRSLVFRKDLAIDDESLTIRCGRCIRCRLHRSAMWAVRCTHEAKMHKHNSFLTLTYDNENIPWDMSVHVREVQLFMKRLRKRLGNTHKKIKYFLCGEYGELNRRPHYHVLLFGYDYPDKKFFKTSGKGKDKNPLYISDLLQKDWGKGHCFIGDVTFNSAAYVARYVVKKVVGKDLHKAKPQKFDGYSVDLTPYQYFDANTGQVFDISPEFVTMSNGIGKSWFMKNRGDVFPHDKVVVNGRALKPPRYYDLIEKEVDNQVWLEVEAKRESSEFLLDNPETYELRCRNTAAEASYNKTYTRNIGD